MGRSDNNYIRTYTGVMIDPFRIHKEEIKIEDIAHALSMMVRANGHLNSFYSIAQHCLNCALEAAGRGQSLRVQLACLLHDSVECYIADVPRPVKHRLRGYAKIEQRVSDVVFLAFGISDLTETERGEISGIDDAMLYYEFKALTGLLLSETRPFISKKHDFSQKQIEEVEREFIREFQRLNINE